MGGAELPSDSEDLDPMLFPERAAPPAMEPYNPKETYEAREARLAAAAQVEETKRYWDGRSFQLTEASALGESLHPPRKP
jgi:hypothetical protein